MLMWVNEQLHDQKSGFHDDLTRGKDLKFEENAEHSVKTLNKIQITKFSGRNSVD